MAKRKPKELPPVNLVLKKAKKSIKKIHLDSLKPPNHMRRRSPDYKHPWPITELAISDGTTNPRTLAFVREKHNIRDYLDRWAFAQIDITNRDALVSLPPTWMDAEFLVSKVLKDPKLSAIFQSCKKRESKNSRALKELLVKYLEEEYIPWMRKRFDEVTDLLSEWIIAYLAEKEHDKGRKKAE